nr:hypothetical protein [uncultured Sphingomonas sp.]
MRTHPTDIITAMLEMLNVFEGLCEDRDTLLRLIETASDRGKWATAHALFQDIRQKTLQAEISNNRALLNQYSFEEICAKTLYNLSGPSASFDADSAFWVLPLGVALGREKGLKHPFEVSSLLRI